MTRKKNGRMVGYIRVSTDKQTNDNQRLAILDHLSGQGKAVDEWIEVKASSRRTTGQRKIDELLELVEAGDTVVVAELSRLGRSVGQVAMLVDRMIESKVRLVSIKEGMDLSGKKTIADKTMLTMFSLFAEIERDLISERTKEGLARARAEGKTLGRPKGPGKSKLDKHEAAIREKLSLGVTKKRIAKDHGTTVDTGRMLVWF